MGFFDVFGKKKTQETAEPVTLTAVAKGQVVAMKDIPDGVFSSGALGQCCGIDPTEGIIYAPMDGVVSMVADTLHAVGMEGNGAELLIHVGVDTVNMNGDGFCVNVKTGDSVVRGQELMTLDLDKVKAAGYASTVITIVTNSDDFKDVSLTASGQVEPGTEFMKLNK